MPNMKQRGGFLFLSAILASGAHAFHVPAIRPAPPGHRRTYSTARALSAPTEDTVSFLPIYDERRREEAIASLTPLLKRQEEELNETRRLLFRLNATSEVLMDESETSQRVLSVATSLITGVDYGFKSRSEGATFSPLKGGSSAAFRGYGPPANVWALGTQQFWRNLDAMRGEYKDEIDMSLTPKQLALQAQLEKLTLNSTEIWRRELKDGPIEAPLIIKLPYFFLCYLLDEVFEGKYVPSRFFFLETVARMPYFSYISMLHIFETLGFWRRSADVKRIHFAEELNEYRHLLIMESLGGDQKWWVRFMAQHSAIAYFIALCILWLLSPSLSYRFSELLETHAVNTYGTFLDENEELLKKLPPSLSAVDYYCFGASDPFYTEFQTSALEEGKEMRRPGENMKSLYDVFSAVRADEGDHVSTMHSCLDPDASVRSVSMEKMFLYGLALAAVGSSLLSGDTSGVEGLADSTSGDLVVDGIGALGLGNLLETLATEGKDVKSLAGGALDLGGPAVAGLEKFGEVVAAAVETIAKIFPFL